MHWKLDDEIIENTFVELDKKIVMVNKKYISLLIKNKIPFNYFSNKAKKCVFVRNGRGKKKKRFNDNDIEKIKTKYKNGLSSYRKLAAEYDCSTRTIYQILKDKY
ncbi:hypothetical protein AXF41_13680 [Clostridium haemolyticum]|uniref:helix-turn-helix domain-containing protein n=1 Tax=Clostridium haemolyticum TaxID=84025 RepID=UPI0009C552DE|nr:helix-turn-helix domain-containing protein [Clostridium haemolyticum]OOB74973.1 hypothetical protein AXF41_13680 [Clostridium haemolyticum]